MIIQDLYAHNFGLIIPKKSGIRWEQQTNGVCCNHIQAEGIFMPLREPHRYKNKEFINLLEKLQEANYDYNTKNIIKIWKDIKKELFFEFQEIKHKDNQEGFMWIKITKLRKNKIMSWNNYSDLLGKKVILIYPNCD